MISMIAEHVTTDNNQVTVGQRDRGAAYAFVFDGPAGLETAIEYDSIVITPRQYVFVREAKRGAAIDTGSVERADLGAVTDVLLEHAHPDSDQATIDQLEANR